MILEKNKPWEKAKVIKLTADRNRSEFKNESWEILDSEESYVKISSPFYNFIYEEIEKMRGNSNEKTSR